MPLDQSVAEAYALLTRAVACEADEPPLSRMTTIRPLTELQALESESIHIFREVAATFRSPVMLFSGGKDSVVMLHLAAKAFWPAPIPFALLHVDTGHNFPEVLQLPRLGHRRSTAPA